jgi:hypothetical protein
MPFFFKEQVVKKSLYPSGLVKSVTFQQADLTDPRVLKMCGLHREGKHFVTDDADAEVVGTYTAKQMKAILKRESKSVKKSA